MHKLQTLVAYEVYDFLLLWYFDNSFGILMNKIILFVLKATWMPQKKDKMQMWTSSGLKETHKQDSDQRQMQNCPLKSEQCDFG